MSLRAWWNCWTKKHLWASRRSRRWVQPQLSLKDGTLDKPIPLGELHLLVCKKSQWDAGSTKCLFPISPNFWLHIHFQNFFLSEIGSPYVAQAGLNLQSSCLYLPVAGITGMYHHSGLSFYMPIFRLLYNTCGMCTLILCKCWSFRYGCEIFSQYYFGLV
jgi:hypothetical protein